MNETKLPYHASNSQEAIDWETQYGANNYAPLPIVVSRGKGAYVWDPEGNRYLDFLSGICAVAQGHCHPKILRALGDQAERLTLPSRAFYSDNFGAFARYATQFFGFDRILMMNTGVEAVETAIKLCRKWGYEKKKLPANSAKTIFCQGNFHGRTLTAISAASLDDSRGKFGPFMTNFEVIPYDDIPALMKALEDSHVAGFVVEPVQGEAGVIVPREGYLKAAYEACKKANVLFIADEVQTGIGRTGRRLACDHEGVKPDIVVLGKALSGGLLPVSAILADNAVMEVFQPGDHGSTFGGNPLACAVARAALEVVSDEKLAENADRLGKIFRAGLAPFNVRGKGLLNAITVDPTKGPSAKDICMKLKEKGLIAKNTREHIIRFAPPLIIDEGQIREAVQMIRDSL